VAVADGREGDEIESLYRDHRDRLWRAVLAFTGDPEIAADSVAEAFAQALRRGDALHSPLRWVWRATFRIAAGEMKSRRNEGPIVDQPYAMAEPATDLVRALAKLAPKQRAALILYHYAGYSGREVARILGSTPPAVRVHLSVGRRRLRELLRVGD
jgi:RNA polymerase sigma-70 factor, ECF subfamily